MIMLEQINYNNRNPADRTWAELLPLVKSYRLEPFSNYNSETFIGRYRVQHWEHDTASQVRICAALGADELLVYREDKWRGDFAHHNRDTIQGYQLEGPWIEELEAERRDMNRSLDAYLDRVRRADLQARSDRDQADAAKIKRFTEAFED
jgi:hypothetical protein